jgi:hypothetical protein
MFIANGVQKHPELIGEAFTHTQDEIIYIGIARVDAGGQKITCRLDKNLRGKCNMTFYILGGVILLTEWNILVHHNQVCVVFPYTRNIYCY